MTSRSPVRLLAATTTPGAHLVARPQGVVHVYTGPLTPSNRFVPRHGSTACRTRTRRLTLLDLRSLLVEFATGRRVACAACSARLPLFGRAEQDTRTAGLARFGHLTPFTVAMYAYLAVNEAEVEWVQWLALLVIGFVAARDTPVVAPTGKTTGPLFTHIDRARRRLDVTRDPYARSNAEYLERRDDAMFHEQVARDQAWAEWREDVARLGHLNAPARPAF